jgi:hypothetical protein
MKNTPKEDAELAFRFRSISYQGDSRITNDDFNSAGNISQIEETVLKIINTSEVLFYIHKNANSTQTTCKCKIPSIFNEIKRYIPCSIRSCIHDGSLKSALAVSIAESFPFHRFNPYVDLFIKNVNDKLVERLDLDTHLSCAPEHLVQEYVDKLNEFIENIRNEAKSKEFRKRLDNHKRQVRQNHRNLMDYIDKLFEKYARILVVRVDLRARSQLSQMTVDTRLSIA